MYEILKVRWSFAVLSVYSWDLHSANPIEMVIMSRMGGEGKRKPVEELSRRIYTKSVSVVQPCFCNRF